MTVRRTKFGVPAPAPRQAAMTRRVLVGPFKGMVTNKPPWLLNMGETPWSDNLIVNNGLLQERPMQHQPSGATLPSNKSHSYWPLVATAYDMTGIRWDMIMLLDGYTSYATTDYATVSGELPPYFGGWVADDTSHTSALVLGAGYNGFVWDTFYEPTSDQIAIAVAGTNIATPFYRLLDTSQSTYTSFLDWPSNAAKYVVSFDDRLVFFGEREGTSGTSYLNRVRWTVRGSPLDFTSVGAGFEDLSDMRGNATALFAEEDRLVLMSNEEVWRGVPRRDAYAFDFEVLNGITGCRHRASAAKTPAGIIWLGNDYSFRLLSGNQVLKFADDVTNVIKDNVTSWTPYTYIRAQYDPETDLYMFFYNQGKEAFFLKVADIRQDPEQPGRVKGDWMHQTLTYDSWYGHAEMVCGGTNCKGRVLYFRDKNLENWGYSVTGDGVGVQPVLAWTSPALSEPGNPSAYEAITDVRMDYEYPAYSLPSFSTVSGIVYTRSGLSGDFDATSAASVHLEATSMWSTALGSAYSYKIPGINHVHFPLEPRATRHPQFMFRTTDSTGYIRGTSFKIHGFDVGLRRFSGRFSG